MLRYAVLFLLFGIGLSGTLHSQGSGNIQLLDSWTKTGLPQTPDYCTFNEVHGFEVNGKEYAVIGATVGGFVFEITADDKLVELGMIPSRGGMAWNIVHRAYKTYRNYLYCVSDESGGLQIIDLNYLPDSINVVYSSSNLFGLAHTIYIDTNEATMYVCGMIVTNNIHCSMAVFSLVDPLNPQLLSTFDDASYVHDAFVRNDTAYLNCTTEGLMAYKFDNGTNPQLLGYLDFYPDQGFNHSGWLSENGKYYAFADETAGMRMKMCDVSDLSDITVIDMFNSEGDSNTIAHNLMWKNGFLYVSHYYDGLQIFDVRNPYDVKKYAWYDTHTANSNTFSGAWGVFPFLKENKILVSDRNNGLFLFRFVPPPTISDDLEHGVYPNPASGETVFYVQEEDDDIHQLSIYDALGKLIFVHDNIQDNYLRFDVSKWSAGTYFYQWEGIESDVLLKGKFVVTGKY